MGKEEFKVLVKGMKAVYPQQTFIPDQDAFNIWHSLLQDLPYDLANKAIQKHMLSSKFPPTIADIRENAMSFIPQPEEMSELEAWSIVYKAICNSNYNAEEEFNKFPEAIKIAVGNPANLKEWAQMDKNTVQSVVQSHFIRNYRTAVERQKSDAKLPQNFKSVQQKQQKFALDTNDA